MAQVMLGHTHDQTYLDVRFCWPEREAYAKAPANDLRAHSSANAISAADALLARVHVYFKNMTAVMELSIAIRAADRMPDA